MPTLTQRLIKLSRAIGADPIHVLAGGGNSSVKTGKTMFVKASGTMMATMEEGDLVEVDVEKVLAIPAYDGFADDRDEKENQIAQLLLDARVRPVAGGPRPSVETVLHALLPQRFVLHTHNEIVNGLTFCRRGPELFRQLRLGSDARAMWVRYVDPGLTLAVFLQKEIARYKANHGGQAPNIIFMAKHGHIVAGETEAETLALQTRCQRAVEALLPRSKRAEKPERGAPAAAERLARAARVAPMIRGQLLDRARFVHYWASSDLERFVAQPNARKLALGGAMCPDQIVYCLPAPLWLELDPANSDDDDARSRIGEALAAFRARYQGRDPKIILVPGIGCLAVGETLYEAHTAAEMYESMTRCMNRAEALGGAVPLTKREADFIDTWSAEQYRRKAHAGAGGTQRLKGQVVAVTGAGQGVGRELALLLAAEGATLAVIDLNAAGAETTARDIDDTHGDKRARALSRRDLIGSRALAIAADIASEEQMRQAVQRIAAVFGGLDVMIANAGILKAHKVTQFPVETWRRIIDVNLVGSFITMKAAAEVMARQRSGNIIQINSKSGKAGSKYNSAYAASKFGGIGLVQSLALDLVEDNIRVNAVCPGNFFDLPLWSAPGGLFDQYRAKFNNVSREEVRKIYEAKVPLGRGCEVRDVLRAVLYILEQEYETGQAYNVTGGQEMR